MKKKAKARRQRSAPKDLAARKGSRVKGGVRSSHPGGVNVHMGDGSVRFVQSSISETGTTLQG